MEWTTVEILLLGTSGITVFLYIGIMILFGLPKGANKMKHKGRSKR